MQNNSKQKKRLIIDFNHISNRLSKEEIDELKAYYMSYHKKMWMYKSAYKRLNKREFAGNISSIVLQLVVLRHQLQPVELHYWQYHQFLYLFKLI